MIASVVIDNYDQGRFLPDAIESALAQDGPLEVIVVDDGSTDDSRQVLDRYRARVTVVEQANGGQACALSAGVALARGEIVCLLDADDVFEPDKLRRVRAVYAADAATEWCFHRYAFVGADLTPLASPPEGARMPVPPDDFDYRAAIESGWLPYLPTGICGMTFRRALADRVFPMPAAPGIAVSDNYLKFLAVSLARGRFLRDRLARQRIHGANRYTGSPERSRQRAIIGTCTAVHLAHANPRTLRFCKRLFVGAAAALPTAGLDPRVAALRDAFVRAHFGPWDHALLAALRVFSRLRAL